MVNYFSKTLPIISNNISIVLEKTNGDYAHILPTANLSISVGLQVRFILQQRFSGKKVIQIIYFEPISERPRLKPLHDDDDESMTTLVFPLVNNEEGNKTLTQKYENYRGFFF